MSGADWVPCPHCGEDIRADARFCRHCGSDDTTGFRDPHERLSDEIDLLPDRLSEEDYEAFLQSEEMGGRSKPGLPAWVWLTAIVLIAALGAAALRLL